MNKNFLHKETESAKLSVFQIIAGIVTGILFSVFFYMFLYVVRESIRILSVTALSDMWILTDSEVSFYNLVFAFISVIFGQSVCFIFWFHRYSKSLKISSRLKYSFLNDQRVLIWYFIFVAFQLAVFYGLWFGQISQGGFYVFSFYPGYNYIFILIIIVLFFQQWVTIRRIYKNTSFKWLAVSLVSVSIFSFGLSKINPIDYNKINQVFLKRNVFHNYLLQLPESDFYSFLERPSLCEEIYVAFPKESGKDSSPLIIIDNEKTDIGEIADKVHYWQSARYEWEAKFIKVVLYVDKDVKVSFINILKKELVKAGVGKIAFNVVPTDRKFDQRYYSNYLVNMSLGWFAFNSQREKELLKFYGRSGNIKNVIDIVQMEKGECIINGRPVEQSRITDNLMNLISKNPNYLIRFYVNEKSDISSYLKDITSIIKAVYELRDLQKDNIPGWKKIPFRLMEIP